LRIVAYNFLSGGSARRAAHWEMLRELRPDVVLAQESRPPAKAHATALWTEACRGWGTGLFAPRLRIEPMHIPGFRGWISGGQLEGTKTRIFSVHAPAGKRGYVQTVHRILDRLRPLARDGELVLGGDFNVVVGARGPDEPVKMSSAERVLLARFDQELGLMPCWQAAHPALPLAQTLRWTGNRAAPYHCDGIFIPKAWRRRLKSCEVIAGPAWDLLSDHNPVLAVLR
jgi:endonuclease/exonuclease/phosphatase family protein